MGRVRWLAPVLCLFLACCTSSAARHARAPGDHPPPTARTTHSAGGAGSTSAAGVPHFAHVVVVIEENRAYGEVIGSRHAPYINALAHSGTLLTHAYGVRHPSEPNYLALFSGSTHGLTDDSCPHRYRTGNLGSQLRSHGQRFVGYSESLPRTGYLGCYAGAYGRKHAPWTDFTNLPARVGKPMSAFPTAYHRLPRVALVVPNLNHDMHDGTVAQGDRWLHNHLGGYVRWARKHNSLLIVTWDEDDRSAGNHIPGVLVGAHVRSMHFSGRVDHYRMLRTIEAAARLPALGRAAGRTPIGHIWTP